ncbi:hypothetical protein [Baaleninema simplex]|nr:hypothetical protein [Baaleninema simplex]
MASATSTVAIGLTPILEVDVPVRGRSRFGAIAHPSAKLCF